MYNNKIGNCAKLTSLQAGISHVEIMIATALIAIISATAMPSVTSMLDRNKIMTTHHQIMTDLNYARQEAASSYRQVVICPSVDQQSCDQSPNWQHGWIIFHDYNSDKKRASSEPIVRVAKPSGQLIINSRGRNQFRFYSDGTAPGSTGSIYVCSGSDSSIGQRVVISNVGRIRSEEYDCGSS